MAVAGFTMSLTAPLEVLYARELGYGPLLMGAFMLTSGIGVIVVDVFGMRLVPALDARTCLGAALALFGIACIAMAVAGNHQQLLAARVVQGFSGGLMLGGGLQAAVRARPGVRSSALALSSYSAAFLFGGAVGAPGGLLVAAAIEGPHGYQLAFAATGALALLVAAALLVALPTLAAPTGRARPSFGLPRFAKVPGTVPAFALAMVGDFLRGGVLFTALPLAGAARGFSTLVIGIAIASMSAVEIVVLTVLPRVLARLGLVAVLFSALGVGCVCATFFAVFDSPAVYLGVSLLFGLALAGTTVGLPLVVVDLVGESSAGLARFRASAGIGMLTGSVGCAVLGTAVGPQALFSAIAVVLAASLLIIPGLSRRLERHA